MKNINYDFGFDYTVELKTEELNSFHQVANQVINDLHELFFEKESISIEKIEEIVIENLCARFSRRRTAELSGYSERGLRNKLNRYK